MEDLTNRETTVVALFALSTPLEPIIDRLEEAGVAPGRMEVVSPLPLSSRQVGSFGRPLHHFTLLGGLAGIGLGLFFTVGTALFYPLMTGGKPIVAPPVVGIIAFENMMLLAIVTTFVTLLLRLRVRSKRAPRDPRIDDGAVALSIDTDGRTAQTELVQMLLNEAGALKTTSLVKEQARPSGPVAPKQSENGIWLWLGYALVAVCSLNACSQDMRTQESYQSQEAPRRHSPAGSIPLHSRTIPPSPSGLPDQRALGQDIFQINCVHCHGPQGNGDGPVAAYLRVLPENLQAGHVQGQSAASLYAGVTEGKGMMPPFKGELSAEERWAVIAYMQSLPELHITHRSETQKR